MPEDSSPLPPPPPDPNATAGAAAEKPLPHLGEEFGTRSKNLPPVKIVLIGVAAVVVVALIFALIQKPHSAASGAISGVNVAEVAGQGSIMVAVNLSIHNGGTKPYWVQSIRADLDTAGNSYSDEAAPAVDFDRYFQAFPALKQDVRPALKRETMIPPGTDLEGTIIVSFPVTPDAFNSRKQLKVTIQPYDQPVPLVLTK